MQRRNLLKRIGVTGIATGLSGTTLARGATVERNPVDSSTITEYLQSDPVHNVSKRIGASFKTKDVDESNANLITITDAEENRVVVEENTVLVRGIRLETNVGVLGLTLQDNKVVQAIFVIRKNSGTDYQEQITTAETASHDHQLIIGYEDNAIYARPTIESERKWIHQNIAIDFEKSFVIEQNSRIYYKVLGDSTKVTIKKQTGEIVERESQTLSDEVSEMAGDCAESGKYGTCMYDITMTSGYCTLAAYACSLTGVSGPQNIVACLSAVANLCGGQLILFKISGACEDVAECVAEFCEENDCTKVTTPIAPPV